MLLPSDFCCYFRAGLQTISAPFSSTALRTVFNSGSRNSSSAKIEGFVELPFGSEQLLRKIPFLQNVDFPISATAAAHPLNVPL